MTIPIRFILYIIFIAPLSLPLNPCPTPLKAIARGFLVLFHTGHEVHQPNTITLINFLHPPPPTSTYLTVLFFIINI
jgi:hypothetical protein